MILADNGSNWFLTGTAGKGWDSETIDELNTIPAGQFQAVDAFSLMVYPDSAQTFGTRSPSGRGAISRAPVRRGCSTASRPAAPQAA